MAKIFILDRRGIDKLSDVKKFAEENKLEMDDLLDKLRLKQGYKIRLLKQGYINFYLVLQKGDDLAQMPK